MSLPSGLWWVFPLWQMASQSLKSQLPKRKDMLRPPLPLLSCLAEQGGKERSSLCLAWVGLGPSQPTLQNAGCEAQVPQRQPCPSPLAQLSKNRRRGPGQVLLLCNQLFKNWLQSASPTLATPVRKKRGSLHSHPGSVWHQSVTSLTPMPPPCPPEINLWL